ncbi:MAG: hypothetical protein HQM12_17820 [SAR324 cluster bacterium]|nr:hypothetical protein [SAR324 cluster bacterium]
MNFAFQVVTIWDLFRLSLRIYVTHFVPVTLMTALMLAPCIILGVSGFFGPEMIVFFLSERVIEAVMTLGIIALGLRPVFPVTRLFQTMKSSLFFSSMHIAIIQYLIFATGMMGLFVSSFPINVIIVTLWISSIIFFSLAQPIFITEGLRSFQALNRSLQIIRPLFARVFLIVMVIKFLQVVLPTLMTLMLLPENAIPVAENPDEMMKALTEFLKNPDVLWSIRLSQYTTSLFLAPFSAIVFSLLCLNLLNIQGQLNMERFIRIGTFLQGIDLPPESPDASQESASDNSEQS